MKVQRIPLEQQLGQVRMGIPAHPEFCACAIRGWAAVPLEAYFGDEARQRARLAEILGIPSGEENRMAYREAAAGVFRLWQSGERQEEAGEAAALLAAPILKYNRERKRKANGEGAENPA